MMIGASMDSIAMVGEMKKFQKQNLKQLNLLTNTSKQISAQLRLQAAFGKKFIITYRRKEKMKLFMQK
jgi:gamma-glutamylcyclotransferase (GGCT)/AIG2-like uncharacterized protein YtfP